MNSLRKIAVAGALVGATAGGAVIGMTMLGPAGAQTSGTAPAAGSQTAPSAPAAPSGQSAPAAPSGSADASGRPAKGQGGPHQANGKTETPLTGDDLAKVTAGVQAKVPGATIDRAETDADGDAFEAHITKSDGTKATVKFDASFNVTSVADGMH